MLADVALTTEQAALFPHSQIQGDANVLVFPDLSSGALGLRLLRHLAGAELVGPILTGLRKPVNVLPTRSSVREVVRAATLTVLQARGGRRR